jgi:hypothetical protein
MKASLRGWFTKHEIGSGVAVLAIGAACTTLYAHYHGGAWSAAKWLGGAAWDARWYLVVALAAAAVGAVVAWRLAFRAGERYERGRYLRDPLSDDETIAMRVIAQADGAPVSINDLETRTGWSTYHTTFVVTSLVRRGYLRDSPVFQGPPQFILSEAGLRYAHAHNLLR